MSLARIEIGTISLAVTVMWLLGGCGVGSSGLSPALPDDLAEILGVMSAASNSNAAANGSANPASSSVIGPAGVGLCGDADVAFVSSDDQVSSGTSANVFLTGDLTSAYVLVQASTKASTEATRMMIIPANRLANTWTTPLSLDAASGDTSQGWGIYWHAQAPEGVYEFVIEFIGRTSRSSICKQPITVYAN